MDYIEAKEFKQYYEFKQAHFEATRYGFPRTRITWRYQDGTEEHSFLPDGPWNRTDRLWERYYPTKVGTIVAERLRNFLVTGDRFEPFFPGVISSVVGISPRTRRT